MVQTFLAGVGGGVEVDLRLATGSNVPNGSKVF